MAIRAWKAVVMVTAIQFVNDMPGPCWRDAKTCLERLFCYLVAVVLIVYATGKE